jgi:hypothetical protein
MRWEGYVARMGTAKYAYILLGKAEGKTPPRGVGVVKMTILKWI